jgi:peptide-methionine (S)-S-oxide reductase
MPVHTKEVALFSGGCFWCEEELFRELPGVDSVTSGYTGGYTINPSYEDVCSQRTGHKEAVQVIFDPTQTTYDELLDIYWHNIDPFDEEGQFCDQGDSYKAVIFYTTKEQKVKAEASKKKWESHFKKFIATDIQKATIFYPAEEYHQDYKTKNPLKYKFYRYSCGRDKRLEDIWGAKTKKD